jgi:hypothetical protein
LLTDFVVIENIFSLAKEFNNNYLKINIMKKLAMVLAVAFTMGLAASTVNASTKDDKKKTECTSTEKKECTKDKKACCSSESKDKK